MAILLKRVVITLGLIVEWRKNRSVISLAHIYVVSLVAMDL